MYIGACCTGWLFASSVPLTVILSLTVGDEGVIDAVKLLVVRVGGGAGAGEGAGVGAGEGGGGAVGGGTSAKYSIIPPTIAKPTRPSAMAYSSVGACSCCNRTLFKSISIDHASLLQFHSSLQPVKLLLPSLQGMLCSEEQAQQRRDELCPLCALFLPPWGQKV